MLLYGESVRQSFKGEKTNKKKIAFCFNQILSQIDHCCIYVVIKEIQFVL